VKAVVIKQPGDVKVAELPDPIPKPDEVLIHPRVCGVCGTDIHIFQGDFIGNYPVIPCHEFAGEVLALGENVRGIKIGDAVTVDPNIRCGVCDYCRRGEINLCEKYDAVGVTRPGGFADLVCVPAQNVYQMGNNDFTAGAFAEPLACVLYGQSRLHITPGTNVLIWGAGAIGLLHMMTLQHLYKSEVTIIDREPERLQRAEDQGAKVVLLADKSLEKELKKRLLKGWDIGIDATGNPDAVRMMFNHLRPGAQALLFGVYPKRESMQVSLFQLFLNDWKIFGSFTYRDQFKDAVIMLSSGFIDASLLVDQSVKLHELPQVLRQMADGQVNGKVHVLI